MIDSSWIDGQVGYLLRRASAAMATDYAAAVAPDGLRPVLVAMLSVIDANPGLGQTDLGRTLGIQRTNTAPLVNQLVVDGLVGRRASPTDGRRVELHLTAAGRRALTAGRRRIDEHERRMTRRLDADELAQLRELLGRIIR